MLTFVAALLLQGASPGLRLTCDFRDSYDEGSARRPIMAVVTLGRGRGGAETVRIDGDPTFASSRRQGQWHSRRRGRSFELVRGGTRIVLNPGPAGAYRGTWRSGAAPGQPYVEEGSGTASCHASSRRTSR